MHHQQQQQQQLNQSLVENQNRQRYLRNELTILERGLTYAQFEERRIRHSSDPDKMIKVFRHRRDIIDYETRIRDIWRELSILERDERNLNRQLRDLQC